MKWNMLINLNVSHYILYCISICLNIAVTTDIATNPDATPSNVEYVYAEIKSKTYLVIISLL